jgi:WD40 repeat protein
LISGSIDTTVRVWDVGSALGNSPSTSSLFTSGDGAAKSIVLTGRDRALEGRREIDVDGDATYLSNDSDHQAGDRSEDQMDVNHGSSEEKRIMSITVSPDGRYVAAGSKDSLIQLWDLQQISSPTGERQPPVLIERLKGHKGTIRSLSFAKNGRFLVSGSDGCDLRVWDVTHLGIAPAPESLSASSPLSEGAGNRDLAKGNDRPVMGGKSKPKSRCIMRLVGHWREVNAVAVSPDGRWVVSGSGDGGVMWWDLGLTLAEVSSSSHEESSSMSTAPVTKWDREAVCRLEGHRPGSGLNSFELSPVGNMLATAGRDGLRICEFFLTCLNELID